jgi:hypothetical protein
LSDTVRRIDLGHDASIENNIGRGISHDTAHFPLPTPTRFINADTNELMASERVCKRTDGVAQRRIIPQNQYTHETLLPLRDQWMPEGSG